jgi:hypothetical protein
MIAQIIPSA